jgi:hypothetical protein
MTIQRRIPTGLKTTKATTNGHAGRKCQSWIESFIDSTVELEAPRTFRQWSAISVIAAALEQKVYVTSGGSQLFPNIYCALIAHPGVGKTRSIYAAKKYYMETPEPVPAPTSMSASSMIDALTKSKRTIVRLGKDQEGGALEYNTLYITADELSAFMHEYSAEAMGFMSHCYDATPYGQTRRGNDLSIKIKSPQLNLIFGTTPSNLVKYMPEVAWEQGFTSRMIMVFSDERSIGDDFATKDTSLSPDLVHDLRSISSLVGEFQVTEAYRDAVNAWRSIGEPPVPTHPKLIHYATRRRVHLYKLSMVSAIDRSDVLVLTEDDFNRAMTWLVQAEANMGDIFKAGAGNADAKAMDEIYHYVLTLSGTSKGPVPERKIIAFAKERVALHSIERVIRIMESSGMIQATHMDKRNGQRLFKACVPEVDSDGDTI